MFSSVNYSLQLKLIKKIALIIQIPYGEISVQKEKKQPQIKTQNYSSTKSPTSRGSPEFSVLWQLKSNVLVLKYVGAAS